MEGKRATKWYWETTNENYTKEHTKDEAALIHLFDCIQDFTNAVRLLEMESDRLGLRDDSDELLPEMNGRTHRGMWLSMKTVSHFNLGIALELLLKLLTFFNGKPIPQGHGLTTLRDDLPPPVQDQLEGTFQDIKQGLPGGCELIAFITTTSPEPPPSPLNRELLTLRDFFEYFDQDGKLSVKRYSYELVEQHQWRHYLSDLTLFIELIRHVIGNIERYIVPEASAEHEGTGTGEQGNEGA